MKPLTIAQLRNLEAGDWVWLITREEQENLYAKFSHHYNNFGREAYCFETVGYTFHLFEDDYAKTWLAYKNKEQAEAKGEIVELPQGWLDTLKLLTCGAMCYADIDDMVAKGMKNSKKLGELFVSMPRVQSTTLQWSLQDLASSKLNCNSIKGFEDVLDVMPKFKAMVQSETNADLRN